MKTFNSEDELCDFVESRLATSQLDSDILRSFAIEFDGVQKTTVWPNLPPGAMGRLFPRLRYAIRDDDLKLLDSLAEGLKSAAAVGFFSAGVKGTQLASAGVGMLVAAARLARQFWKKGALLDPFELRVLLLLKANAPKGLTTDDVLDVLGRTEKVELATVEAALRQLSKYPVSDGSTVPFVSEDGMRRWRAAGV